MADIHEAALAKEAGDTTGSEADGSHNGVLGQNAEKMLEEGSAPTPAAAPAGPPRVPPNGGLTAWLQVVGGFFVYFNTWGLINTFGVFQAYYQTNFLSSYSPSDISWIGTVQGFLLVEVGIFCGPLLDKGSITPILAVGSVLTVLGVMMTSLAEQYYSIFLSLGVCSGVGMGLVFFPGISAITMYFTTKRATATGIAASGSALGAIIYPIVLRQLIPNIGFPWAVRVVGFIALATLLPPLFVMKPLDLGHHGKNATNALDAKTARKIAFSNKLYLFFCIANVIPWLGVLTPNFYLPAFAEQQLGVDANDAFYLSSILGAGSVIGRTIPGLIADKVGAVWVYPTAMLASGIIGFAWMGVTTWGGAIALAFFWGLASGGVVALPPSVVAAIATDMRTIATMIGLGFAVTAIGFLVGNPIAGAIVRGNGGYRGLQGFTGAALIIGAIFMYGLAIAHRREARRKAAAKA